MTIISIGARFADPISIRLINAYLNQLLLDKTIKNIIIGLNINLVNLIRTNRL